MYIKNNTADKVVLLDFCGTVVDFQTFVPYIESVLEHAGRNDMFLYKIAIISAKVTDRIVRQFNDKHYYYKDTLVRLTKGISLDEFDVVAKSFFEDKIEPHYIRETIDLIEKYKAEGFRIVLLSAACKNYLEIFAEKYEISDIVSTEICFENKKSVGHYKFKDCIREEKVHRIVKYFNGRKEFDVAISDSKTDTPMLNICKEKIVISNRIHQSWIDSEMEEIIYEH